MTWDNSHLELGAHLQNLEDEMSWDTHDDKPTYNGWRNHATWNIALHMGSNEDWYMTALLSTDYNDFQNLIGRLATDDGVKLTDGDYDELTDCILEMQESG